MWGTPLPFAENSAKIIDLIFEPFFFSFVMCRVFQGLAVWFSKPYFCRDILVLKLNKNLIFLYIFNGIYIPVL